MLSEVSIDDLGSAEDQSSQAGDRNAREQAESKASFEGLLAELSACFINLPPDQVDAEIQKAQRAVCRFFQLERSAVWQLLSQDSGMIQLTHLHHEPLRAPVAGKRAGEELLPEEAWRIQMPVGTAGFVAMDGDKLFPWITRQFRSNQAIIITRLDDLPSEAAADREFLRHYGTRSSVMIPLLDGATVMGAITFATLHEEREWAEAVLQRLQVVARIFAHAIARKRMDQLLRDSEARLLMATESANVGLWDMDIGSGAIWATGKTRELFGLATDDTLDCEKLVSLVHPEDLELFRQSIRRATQAGEPVRVDLRIRCPGGGFRWITWCGRACEKLPGDPARMIGVVLDITERKRMEDELQQKLHEITELKKQLERENYYLREEFRTLHEYSEIVGRSTAIQKVFKQIEQVAATDSHVLITGETGTGKELVARAIHAASRRKDRVMVKVNCATLPATLIESELFGREKGAYTGALTGQAGRFELADGGTIFLDEIGELSLELQVKLLRVLQEGEFERLGGPRTLRVNVRVIAATNRNLAEAVRKGEFRKDLFYRLSVFPIEVPPLRERIGDIPLLVWEFIDQFSERMGKCIKSIPQKTMERLIHYSWPGNIRELRNTIERAMILSPGDRLELQMPVDDAEAVDSTVRPFKEAEQRLILEALHKAGGHIKGPRGAAALLGLKPSTLYTKMNKLGIQPHRQRDVQPT